MPAREIKTNIFAVGAIDWDRQLFDAFVPLPQGTSYNSYLIRGSEKTALIDTVDSHKWSFLRKNLKSLSVEKIDYIISNHAEQDHSAAIAEILKLHPETQVVTNSKAKGFLLNLIQIPEERFLVINDRDTLSLGDKTLEFISAPWVHWPETMFTFLQEEKILFSCDLFGSHLATSELFATQKSLVYREAKRYFAQIMMPYSRQIKKYMQIIDSLNVEMIAPSHGPVYNDPEFIMDAYRDWISDEVKNQVAIFFISMHDSTRQMVDHLSEALMARGIHVKPFNLENADFGEIAMALVDSASIVLASPAFLIGPHPKLIYAAFMMNALKPKAKYGAVIGSFSWGNKLVDQTVAQLKNLKLEYLEPVLSNGKPDAQVFEKLDALAEAFRDKHASLQI